MNWDQISGQWKTIRGKVREQWGKLTDDDLDQIAGKREQLIGSIQRRYGTAKEEVEKQVRQWEARMEERMGAPSEDAMDHSATRTGSPQRSGPSSQQSPGRIPDSDFGSSQGGRGGSSGSGQGGQQGNPPGGKGGQSNPGGSQPSGR